MSDASSATARTHRVRSASHPLERILELVRVLRGPGGCPWDREQTVESMTPYLQEETYEVVEAVAAHSREAFREELGDLLFLVLFMAEAAADDGRGDLEAISEAVVEKLIRRHPHVFEEDRSLGSDGAVGQWERIKQAEKQDAASGTGPASTLGKRPKGLPALTTAFRISEKAGAVGFQWPTVREALGKLDEEVAELAREVERDAPRDALEDELGDVLYSVVNVARYLGVDPERALRRTTAKFTERFQYIERKLAERGRTPSTSGLEEMDALWNEAKRVSADPAGGA